MSSSSSSWYQQCRATSSQSSFSGESGTDHVLQCITSRLEDDQLSHQRLFVSWLLLLCGALVFFMQAGFAMICAGCVRKKNVQNTMLKNLLDACGSALAFYAVGFAFAFGGQNETSSITFLGSTDFFLSVDADFAVWFFEYAFSASAVTIVAGTLAERCQMTAYLCYSFLLAGFVYPVIAHALWSNNGFLSAFSKSPLQGIGAIDFSGSGVVHLTGGTTALIATYILGPRRGRFHDNRGQLLEQPLEIKGHSTALQLLGTMILWFGWYGFNPGSALLLTTTDDIDKVALRAAVTTTLSGAAGALTGLVTRALRTYKQTGLASFDLTITMNGALSGLVAITAPCATVEPYSAIMIGMVSAWIYMGATKLLVRWRIDDAVDAIPVHLFNGAWGLLATGLFSSPQAVENVVGSDKYVGWFYSVGRASFDATLLSNQLIAIVFIISWCSVIMIPFFMLLNYMRWLRADALDELLGLDASFHGQQGQFVLPDDVSKRDLQHAYKESMTKKKRSHDVSDNGMGESKDTDDMLLSRASADQNIIPSRNMSTIDPAKGDMDFLGIEIEI